MIAIELLAYHEGLKDQSQKQGLYFSGNYHVWLECSSSIQVNHPLQSYRPLALDSWLKIIVPIHQQEDVLFPYCLYLFHLIDSCTKRLRVTFRPLILLLMHESIPCAVNTTYRPAPLGPSIHHCSDKKVKKFVKEFIEY